MAVDQWPAHGGEVDAAAARYGVPRDRWLDLSTGINPNPYPLPDLAGEYWHRLPDADVDTWLREAAAKYYGVADPALVVPARGSQALIRWLPRVLPPTRVAILGPTYREHQASWIAAGHAVLAAAGGSVCRIVDGQPLVYGKPGFENPHFVAAGWLQD